MSSLSLVPTAPDAFSPAAITEAEAAAMFRAIGLLVGTAAAAEYGLANAILRLVSYGHSPFYHAYPLV
ncbi:MAG: hypothetical protein U0987_13790, partial [Afipia sp.]|nr:hypothetical protein [Afipia sp.]